MALWCVCGGGGRGGGRMHRLLSTQVGDIIALVCVCI